MGEKEVAIAYGTIELGIFPHLSIRRLRHLQTVGNHKSVERLMGWVHDTHEISCHHFVSTPESRALIDVGNIHCDHGIAGLEPCVRIFSLLEGRLDGLDVILRHHIEPRTGGQRD